MYPDINLLMKMGGLLKRQITMFSSPPRLLQGKATTILVMCEIQQNHMQLLNFELKYLLLFSVSLIYSFQLCFWIITTVMESLRW